MNFTKFAWLPTRGVWGDYRALIWLQKYKKYNGYNECNHLHFFSIRLGRFRCGRLYN